MAKHLKAILAEEGPPIEDKNTQKMMTPGGRLDVMVNRRTVVPGVTDQDSIFQAANLRRAVPNKNETTSHGHVPVPADNHAWHAENESVEETLEDMLAEAVGKKKPKPKKKSKPGDKPALKEPKVLDDHQLCHMAQYFVNGGMDATTAMTHMQNYRKKFPLGGK